MLYYYKCFIDLSITKSQIMFRSSEISNEGIKWQSSEMLKGSILSVKMPLFFATIWWRCRTTSWEIELTLPSFSLASLAETVDFSWANDRFIAAEYKNTYSFQSCDPNFGFSIPFHLVNLTLWTTQSWIRIIQPMNIPVCLLSR